MNRYGPRFTRAAWLALGVPTALGHSPPQNARCLNCHGSEAMAQRTAAERA